MTRSDPCKLLLAALVALGGSVLNGRAQGPTLGFPPAPQILPAPARGTLPGFQSRATPEPPRADTLPSPLPTHGITRPNLTGIHVPAVAVPGQPSGAAPLAGARPAVGPLTLEEAKQRTLANSKALHMAQLLVQEKGYATRAAQSYYLPQVGASLAYTHLDSFLGSVLTPGRRLRSGPFAGVPIDVAIFNQDQRYAALTIAQPITALFKVRQGVRIARADQRTAEIQVEKAIRELQKGVEDVYFGLLATQRIRLGAMVAVGAAEKVARATGAAQDRLVVLQARQGLQAATKEVAALTEQLNSLLDQPLCTELELVRPAPPAAPVGCADEAIGLALAASPDIRTAHETIEKANAGVRVAKLAYVPDVNVIGFSVAQDGIPSIQNGFSGVALVGSVSLFEGGRRRAVVRERETLLALAHENLRDTEDKVRLAAQKAYREFIESGEALKTAGEALKLYQLALKEAATPAAQKAAVEAQMKGELDYVKAELAQRMAYAQLTSLIGK